MKHNANLDVKGVVIGSSASISSMNAVQYIGSGTASTFGTLVLSNSDVTFGMNGSTITASHSREYRPATQWLYPIIHGQPFWCGPDDNGAMAPNNLGAVTTTGATAWTTNLSMQIAPLPDLLGEAHYNVIEVFGLDGINSAATVTASGSECMQIGIYTRSSNSFYQLSVWNLNERVSQNGQARTFRMWTGTDSDNATDVNSNSYTFASATDLNASFGTVAAPWQRVVVTSGTAVSTLTPGVPYFAVWAGSSRRANANSPTMALQGGFCGHYGFEATLNAHVRVGSASNTYYNLLQNHAYTLSSQKTAASSDSGSVSFFMPTSFVVGNGPVAGVDILLPLMQFIRSTW